MTQLPIYTIGYGGAEREIGDFLDLLTGYEINFLIDVRSQPSSRFKPAFSRKALAEHLAGRGIRYVFMGEQLGGRPDDPACYSGDEIDYAKVAARPAYQQGIARLQDAHRQGLRVALMCAESRPEACHRTHLLGQSLTAAGIAVAHIDETGRLLSQDEVLQRLPPTTSPSKPPALTTTPPPPEIPPPPEAPPLSLDDMPQGLLFDDFHGAGGPPPDVLPSLPPVPTYDGSPDAPFSLASAKKLLRQIFGYDTFRPLQEEIITNVMANRDSLAIMPTGSGKSLCYQLPALMRPGLTVVVSPLISLMEDQVMQLRALGVPAVALNSTLSPPEQAATIAAIRDGRAKLLYVAPETLLRPDVLDLLDRVAVDCLTIDEAHCISEWGHDFRPEYRRLREVRQRLPQAVCLAVTATATERVRQDITSTLEIDPKRAFIASFNRENLFLAVAPKADLLAQTLTFLENHADESGIIYCATRRQVDELTAQLQTRGWQALPYHAGLGEAERRLNQQRFTRDDTPIIVATIAFGMGINKPNVRFVLHVDLPKNLESYYQQIGRAGRDGLPADCLLLYSYADVQTINYFIQQQHDTQQIGARMRLEAMLAFVESNACRRKPLLNYFDEPYEIETCDTCDNCTAPETDLVDLTVPAQKFLSCVVRTGQIFGTNHIIDVLRGSQSKKIIDRGHDRLSTYNIGAEFSKKEWQYLARQFIQQGLLNQDMEHGSLQLLEAGRAVLQGEPFQGTLLAEVRRTTAVGEPHDPELFALLRRKRKELADADGVPPYVIFSDRALTEMATFFPDSENAFGRINGVGQVKLEKYAPIFLPIIREYCTAKGLEPRKISAAPPPRSSSTSSAGGRTVEVAELFRGGMPPDEIAAHFDVKLNTVFNHLWKTIQAGETLPPIDLRPLSELPPDLQKRVFAAFAKHGPDMLRPVFEELRQKVSYDELHLLRLHYAINRAPS